jgi:hypothetical protein
MMRPKHLSSAPLILALVLQGCGLFTEGAPTQPGPVTGGSEPLPAAETPVRGSTAALGASTARAEDLDTTSAAEKTAALSAAPAAGEQALGKVVVALGPPAEQGLWLSTTLVDKVMQGRVETAGGKSLALELRPGAGGALLSLAAYQALGLGLTELPELAVYAQ